MSIGEAKPLQVKVENLEVKQFFDRQFVEILEKEIEGISFQHFCFSIAKKKEEEEEMEIEENMAIIHKNIKAEMDKVAVLDADKPETLEKLLKVVKQFVERR